MGRTYLGKRPVQMGQPASYTSTPSTGTKLTPAGDIYYLSSTAAAKTWILQAPGKIGIGKKLEIHCVKATTSLLCRVQTSACSFFSSVSSTATTTDVLRFNNARQSAVLLGYSSAKWRLSASHGSPTLAAT